MARWLMTFGVLIVLGSLCWPWLHALGLARLPGDLLVDLVPGYQLPSADHHLAADQRADRARLEAARPADPPPPAGLTGSPRARAPVAGGIANGASCLARWLIILGVVLVLAGLLWPWLDRLGLGRLPGDILIERDEFPALHPARHLDPDQPGAVADPLAARSLSR